MNNVLGSDFVPRVLTRTRRCDCGKKMLAGETYLASVRDGKVMKWVCSEDCRLEFDARIWQVIARRNARRRNPALR